MIPHSINPESNQLSLEPASYLPMMLSEFTKMFDIAINSGEITAIEKANTLDDQEVVVGYYMNDKLYACKQRIAQIHQNYSEQ